MELGWIEWIGYAADMHGADKATLPEPLDLAMEFSPVLSVATVLGFNQIEWIYLVSLLAAKCGHRKNLLSSFTDQKLDSLELCTCRDARLDPLTRKLPLLLHKLHLLQLLLVRSLHLLHSHALHLHVLHLGCLASSVLHVSDPGNHCSCCKWWKNLSAGGGRTLVVLLLLLLLWFLF